MNPNFENPQLARFNGVSIPLKSVIHRLGYPHDALEKLEPGIRSIVQEELTHAQALFEPRGIYRLLQVVHRDRDEIAFREHAFRLHSTQVAAMLSRSDTVVFFMVTLGPGLEKAIDGFLRDGETTRAFILDAIGSETADALADELHWNRLHSEAERLSCRVTPRFSPGYGDWPLTVQTELMELCDGGRIGISLTPSCLMIPQKSISAVLGWNRKE